MAKLVHIHDVKMLNIFESGKTRGPVTLRLSESIISKILNQVDGPRDVFAVNPEDRTQEIKLTLENYNIPEEELFGKATSVNKNDVIDDPVQKTLEALKGDKEEVKEEVNDSPVDEEEKEIVDTLENSDSDEVAQAPVNEITDEESAPVNEETEESVFDEEEKEDLKEESSVNEEKKDNVAQKTYSNKQNYNKKKHK